MRPDLQHRRFMLTDALILVAATAVGFALARPALLIVRQQSSPWPAHTPLFRFEFLSIRAFLVASSALIALSIAQLVLCMLRPRPSTRRLIRQPGFVLCVAGLLGAVVMTCNEIAQNTLFPNTFVNAYSRCMCFVLPYSVGPFVLGAWLPFLLRGRPCPLPTWTDRLAWTLGVAWVVLMLARWGSTYFALVMANLIPGRNVYPSIFP